MSGQKAVVTNTRERAVSNDLNRMQAFGGASVAELLRYLIDVSHGSDELDAAAIATEYLTTEAPLRAEIVGGLLARPQVGSLSCTVDPGLLFAVSPSASTDDSPYRFVRDAGVPITSPLSFVSNVGGGDIRVDVLECAPQDVVVESDNRDVFNPITGLFTATTVAKATQTTLKYRIRQGVVGAGFPGVVAGWLPLLVASIPDGAATCDAMTFWDVRPMLNDRANLQNTSMSARRIMSRIDAVNNVATAAGVADWVHTIVDPAHPTIKYPARRLGGRLRRGTPGTDGDFVNLNDPANFSPNMAGSADGSLAYLYLGTAFNLPRWARYTDATSGSRVPRSPRGIVVMSPNGPEESGQGFPLMPTSLGLGGGNFSGVCIATTIWDGAEMISFADSGTAQCVTDGTATRTGTISAPNVIDYTLTATVDYPAHARELLVVVAFTLPTATPPLNVQCSVRAMARGQVAFEYREDLHAATSDTAIDFARSYWLPIEPTYPSSAPSTTDVQVVLSDLADTIGAASILVLGWRY